MQGIIVVYCKLHVVVRIHTPVLSLIQHITALVM